MPCSRALHRIGHDQTPHVGPNTMSGRSAVGQLGRRSCLRIYMMLPDGWICMDLPTCLYRYIDPPVRGNSTGVDVEKWCYFHTEDFSLALHCGLTAPVRGQSYAPTGSCSICAATHSCWQMQMTCPRMTMLL